MKEKITKDMRDLVVARLEVMPANVKLSIGSEGDFSKNELIEHVKKEDDPIGKKIIEIELEFLRALKEGIIT